MYMNSNEFLLGTIEKMKLFRHQATANTTSNFLSNKSLISAYFS